MEREEEIKNKKGDSKPVCGIIMPISAIDGCPGEHWAEVKNIISESICAAGYDPNLVSDAEDIGIIQKRIIQNIYNNDIVVCDVSGKNPNVMFELGMRLAFDKPAIIVIDDKTDYSFDTSPIEHLSYPRDLRYNKILEFKEQLAKKIKATVEKAKSDSTYTTFLKNFGTFEIAHLEKKEGTINDLLLERMDFIAHRLYRLEDRLNITSSDTNTIDGMIFERIQDFCNKEKISVEHLKKGGTILRDKLFDYLEESLSLRRMCGNSEILRGYMERALAKL